MSTDTEIRPLNGPKITCSDGPAQRLVIFLHGVGADGNDLIDLGRHWQALLPQTDFLSPNAPFRFDMAPFGFQWFSLQGYEPQLNEKRLAQLAVGVAGAVPHLHAFIDSELEARGLTEENLALVGFSQGTMTALHAAPQRSKACAAVVGFSGALADPASLMGENVVRPPILLVHGEEDPVVPIKAMELAEPALKDAGFSVEAHRRPGLPHGIDGEGLKLGALFLRKHFGLD